MSAKGVHSSPSEPPERAVRRQLQKILASGEFAPSERMSRFLRFAVEESLAGRAGQLKESVIGVAVFDREAHYDSRTDPIVRVEARRLRAKLERYYEREGQADQVRIEFRRGGYAPVFHHARASADSGPPPGNTIAVLPFANLSSDADNEYFSDGLTEELIHVLTRLDGLRVVAWHSASQVKGRQGDVAAIARKLNVRMLLEGSVRRSGDRLRVTAQLVDPESGYYLWSESFDRELRDVFSIQDEIAQAIARVLEVRLGRSVDRRRASPNPKAYNHYLRGRFFWNKRTEAGMLKSVECYEQAIAVDPGFALGFAGLADSWSVLADYGMRQPAETMPKAKKAAKRALELDPDLAEAHTSLGFILSLYDHRWREAGERYRRAIELNPGYATAHHWYSCDYLALLGRFREARREMRLARELNPLSSIVLEGEGYIRLLERDYEGAAEHYRQLCEMDPGFYKAYTGLGRVHTQMGKYDEAIELLEKGRSMAGNLPSILGALGQTYALMGKHGQARSLLGELTEMRKTRFIGSSCFALIHAGLGEIEKALDWLEQGCERRELPLSALSVHPAYDALRPDTRFRALVKMLGLA